MASFVPFATESDQISTIRSNFDDLLGFQFPQCLSWFRIESNFDDLLGFQFPQCFLVLSRIKYRRSARV